MKRIWKNYNLSVVLAALFLGSWVIHGWTGWNKFASEQKEHGQKAEWFGEDCYVWDFAASTFENWQSEFLQLLSFVVLTSCLIHKGSPESKDSDEEMKEKLDTLLDRVEELEETVRENTASRRA